MCSFAFPTSKYNLHYLFLFFPASGCVPNFPAGKKRSRSKFKWIIVVNGSNVSMILDTKCIMITFSYDYNHIKLLCECKNDHRSFSNLFLVF